LRAMTNRQIGVRASPATPARKRQSDEATKRAEPVRAWSAVRGPLVAALVMLGIAASARAADTEGCLSCHRYRGLARVTEDRKTIALYYVDPNYYVHELGPHAKLQCTDCHNRAEVEVIPHRPTTPVNCSRTCHLAPAGQLEVVFSHDTIAGELNTSVHTSEHLTEANRLLGEPLRPGQWHCLLCHDEPVFRWADETWAQQAAPIHRCNVCHTEQLPKDTRYYYWHVYARSRSARSHRDIVRVCALCHSDQRILTPFGLPNSAASYLNSFHGKAMLLGSERAAICLNCHVGPLQNVHLMLPPDNPNSSVNPARLPSTCRSPMCHPFAAVGVSTAAVHLELATSHGIDRFIAIGFFLLIIFTFGPSVVLQTLEMLQIVCGRHDPAHDPRRRLAEELLRRPEGRRLLQRFTVHQRVQHWILVVSFTTLVITGFPIKFADREWAGAFAEWFGGFHILRMTHHTAGAVLILGMLYHLAYIGITARQDKRRRGKSIAQTILDLPMVMRWRDWKELWHHLGYLLFLRRTRPEMGRFGLKEKFEYFGVFWGSMLLGVTGILMWANSWTTQHLTGSVLTVANLIHTFEAFLALLHVGVIHLIGVILSPTVFPLSPAMFTGKTPPEELAEAHSVMIAEAAKELGIKAAEGVSHG
jgi:cytochrome b subunit of formate dehydrogenase/nitrate reductase cytochrome c-type subunit